MMLNKDFTWLKYDELLSSLQRHGYEFRTFEEYCQGNRQGRFVLLRHDVDARPWQSLRCAQIEEARRIRSSYYFRKTPKFNCPEVIQEIIALNHEIGYHYEELSLTKGDSDKAIDIFEDNLAYFRLFYPVQTICMHGSPTSSFDNRDLWKKYDYRRWGIIGEPYFDIDFNDMTYLTDTGRCWNGQKFNVRDKVKGSTFSRLHTTGDIIGAIAAGILPDRIMITTHPQRWTDNRWQWWREFISQKLKNQAKRVIVWYDQRRS
jgi:hypothetical protein